MPPCQTLPSTYRLARTIDLRQQPALMLGLNLIGLVLLLLFGWLFFWLAARLRPQAQPGLSFSINLAAVLAIIFAFVAVLLLHELVHGAFFWLITRSRPRFGLQAAYAYAAAPDWYIPRNPYLIVGLAPFVGITLVGRCPAALAARGAAAAVDLRPGAQRLRLDRRRVHCQLAAGPPRQRPGQRPWRLHQHLLARFHMTTNHLPAETPPGIPPEDDYTTPVRLTLRLNAQEISVVSKPGLAEWRQVTPAAALLAEHALLPPDARALLLGSGHGAAAVILARRLARGELWVMDNSAIALEMSAATLQANRVSNARIQWEISLPQSENGRFDAAAIELPKGRKLAQRWLAEAYAMLRPGGALYLAGANELGVQSTLHDAASLFGPGTILDYKKGNRVTRFTRPTGTLSMPGWLRAPGIAPRTWHEFDAETPVGVLHLFSLPGVFSFDRLDDATRLLLAQMHPTPADHLLDLGCGCGILGLVAAQMGAERVDLVDVNLLAVAAARQNIRHHGLHHAQALPSDVLGAVAGQAYTRIVTNPPFHAGKGVDYHAAAAFIRQSSAALEPGGELLLVANRFIRYEKLMESLFRQISLPAQDERYRVLSAVK